MTKHTARLGDIVCITKISHFNGIRGIICNVHAEGIVSIAISPLDATDYIRTTMKRSPDGHFHIIANPEEFEIVERVKGVY